jgi:hypothetical protein
MSILKSLKLANAKPVRTSDNPAERVRDKVISTFIEQKTMAEAKIAGQHLRRRTRSGEGEPMVSAFRSKRPSACVLAGSPMRPAGSSSASAMLARPSSSPRTRTQ